MKERRAEEWTEENGELKENTEIEKEEKWSEGEETRRAEEWTEETSELKEKTGMEKGEKLNEG